MIRKNRNKYDIENQITYGVGSNDLDNEQNDTYIDKVTQIIRNNIDKRLKNIYFNIQNDEIIIRNIKNIKSIREKEITKLIECEISDYMPIDLQKYVIKYKKIINTKRNKSIQGILFPKKYVSICKSISEKLKIKKQYLYINFDILQKLIDLKVIDLSKSDDDKVIIIENRDNIMIFNTILNKNIIESYVVDKDNSKHFMNQFLQEEVYYYGVSDNFIESLGIKKLQIENKLILKNNEKIIDMTLDYLPAWGMII